jgi:hypothetical protein
MGFFRRRPKPKAGLEEAHGADATGARTVHERIEVTVEREWVSMVVRNPATVPWTNRPVTDIEGSAARESNEERLLESPDTETPENDQPD